MKTLSLSHSWEHVKESYLDISCVIARVLYDPYFFEIQHKENESETIHKVEDLIETVGHKFQDTAQKSLADKSSTGDFAPRPTGKILTALAEEAFILFGKSVPYILPRVAGSQAFLYAACFGCCLAFLGDEHTRTAIMDQVNHLTSAFHSSTEDKELPPTNVATHSTVAPNTLAKKHI